MNPDDPEEVRRRRLARLGVAALHRRPSPTRMSPPPSARASPPPSARASPPSSARPASSSGQKRPAQQSPVASPTPTKKTIPVDRALRRVLRCNIVDGTPKSGGEIFEVTKSEVNGALDEKSCGAVVALRLQRAKSGEDALQLLHEIFVRCRDEARTARSRNDDACEKAVQSAGTRPRVLASVCLVRPGALGGLGEGARH